MKVRCIDNKSNLENLENCCLEFNKVYEVIEEHHTKTDYIIICCSKHPNGVVWNKRRFEVVKEVFPRPNFCYICDTDKQLMFERYYCLENGCDEPGKYYYTYTGNKKVGEKA